MISQAIKRSRIAVAGAVVALMLVPLAATPSVAATTGYRDVLGNHRFYREISWVTQAGIANGYAASWFRPDRKVQREEFAAFLYRAAGSPKVTTPKTSPFKDVKKTDKFYKPIVWLEQEGISNGWSDGSFRPNWSISRAQLAAFLYRFEGKPSYTPPSKSRFKDVKTSYRFYKEISWFASTGMTTGYADGTFKPGNGTSRAETSAFLFRGFGKSSYKAPSYVAPKVPWKPSEIISVAKSQVGFKQPSNDPLGNSNKYNSWIGGNSEWCAVYVSWVFEKAGYPGYVPKEKYFSTAYTSSSNNYVSKLKSSGVLDWNVSLGDLQQGDVVLINWRQGQGASHTGIVDKVAGNGVWLYEGNTTSGTGSATRGVFHRWRSLSLVDAVYDPRAYYNATH